MKKISEGNKYFISIQLNSYTMKNNTIAKIEITQNQICYAKSNKFISILFHLDSIYVRSFESLLQLVLVHLRLKNVSYSISACKFGRGKKIWIMKIRIFSCRSLGFGEKQLWKRVHDYFKQINIEIHCYLVVMFL